MKKVFLFVALSAFATLGFSQSKWMVEGNISFGTQSGDYSQTIAGTSTTTQIPSSLGFGIGVDAAYLITDNLAVGLGIGFGLDKTTDESVANTTIVDKQNVFIIRPQVHYFLSLNDKFVYAPALYVEFGFGGISQKVTTLGTSTEQTGDLSGFGVALSPLSFDFHLTDNIALHLAAGTIGFSSSKFSNEQSFGGVAVKNEQSNSNFDIKLNPSNNLGFILFY
jgi:hypothetical protein